MISPRIKRLREKANSLPLSPGVYIMRDKDGTVIYVGKSKKLKNRVSSYFVDTGHSIKTARMVSRVEDFEFIICHTEMEALTLENVLIKEHSPRYNIKLKDAKSYPYIKIPRDTPYPRPTVTRTRADDGAEYFGPYRSAATAYDAVETVSGIFALPTCNRKFPRDIGKERPCIYRQMGRCCAPCVPDIDERDYRALIRSVAAVLSGHTASAEAELTAGMYAASDAMLYELAGHYKRGIEALRQLSEKQLVVSKETVNRDVFALYEGAHAGVLAVLTVRGGKLLYKNEYTFDSVSLVDDGDIAAMLIEYYSMSEPPAEVLLDRALDAEQVAQLSDYLSSRAGRRVEVREPKRGDARKLVQLALENARQRAETESSRTEKQERTLATLASMLGLEVLPQRIEAYDISNIGAEKKNCSMVVYIDGEARRSDYRTFSIKTVEGQDDYASMYEAISRRLAHIGDGSPSLGERPDLILLDGGVGHMSVIAPLTEKYSIPTFGMVKDDHHKTRALVDRDREISIARTQSVYMLIFAIQEEAHRVAVRQTMGQKRRTLRHSTLERIEGIGPKKAKLLLTYYGTLGAVREADRESLLRVKGITETDALNIVGYFKAETDKKSNKEKKPPEKSEETET